METPSRVFVVRTSERPGSQDSSGVPGLPAEEALRVRGYAVSTVELPESKEKARAAVFRATTDHHDIRAAIFGGKLRILSQNTELFEAVVNTFRAAAPTMPLCFSTVPDDYVAAMIRLREREDEGIGVPPAPGPTGTTGSATRVLLVRMDTAVLDYSRLLGVDQEALRWRYIRGEQSLEAAGYDVVSYLIGRRHAQALADIVTLLSSGEFSTVLFGGRLRMFPEYTALFERVVELVARTAPQVTLRFASAPEDGPSVLRRP